MFRLLSDGEVALNALFVACSESVDHYQDAIELVADSSIANPFDAIINSRKVLIDQLEKEIRQLGDLPPVPDPDKAMGEIILHHLGAALTPDYHRELIAQRLAAEEKIKSLIITARTTLKNLNSKRVLDELMDHVEQTIGFLVGMGKDFESREIE